MSLWAYILRRLILLIPMFFLSTVIIFSLIHLAPGDPIRIMFTESGHPPPEQIIQQLRRSLGLDQPIYVQYLIWINKIVHGDLGVSYSGAFMEQPVADLIASMFWNTLILMLTAQMLALILATVLGVVAAAKQYSVFDHLSSMGALFGYSMPDFWLGLMLIFFLALGLRWFPMYGTHTAGSDASGLQALLDYLWHLILPVVCVTVVYTGWLFRMVRSTMLDILRQDYVTTARAKGVKERVVIYKHALRNALLPVVTIVGLRLGFLLSGAVVTETVFAWPGLGRLAVTFALMRDYQGLMSLSVIIVLMVYVANLCTDVAYSLIDPRLRY
jgi:peptide/nickel transport system permease protein